MKTAFRWISLASLSLALLGGAPVAGAQATAPQDQQQQQAKPAYSWPSTTPSRPRTTSRTHKRKSRRSTILPLNTRRQRFCSMSTSIIITLITH